MDSFTIELVSNASSQLFPNNTIVHLQNSCRSNEIGRTMGGSNFRDFLPINVPKTLQRGKLMFYDAKLSKTTELTILNPDCIPPKLILWKLWTLSFKKETTTDTLASQSKLEGNAKSNSLSGEWRVESCNF